ncbi:hypothetical protein CY34DRAFT_813607 [Suillus luteus UH-Slu-Lm8-n1]|uniref:Uncharacterized protein n=1 Tax=Suillus luteus UH-Slu-Lm8-n1 TaxID=930992 RepID=A0A0C9ZVK4_9AGAM|nr:hypothetical protein CY34DRAFT_813607 [Suillus luteus UH-Slu-Lm8-n1]
MVGTAIVIKDDIFIALQHYVYISKRPKNFACQKEVDAYGELTALAMEQRDWWNRHF